MTSCKAVVTQHKSKLSNKVVPYFRSSQIRTLRPLAVSCCFRLPFPTVLSQDSETKGKFIYIELHIYIYIYISNTNCSPSNCIFKIDFILRETMGVSPFILGIWELLACRHPHPSEGLGTGQKLSTLGACVCVGGGAVMQAKKRPKGTSGTENKADDRQKDKMVADHKMHTDRRVFPLQVHWWGTGA